MDTIKLSEIDAILHPGPDREFDPARSFSVEELAKLMAFAMTCPQVKDIGIASVDRAGLPLQDPFRDLQVGESVYIEFSVDYVNAPDHKQSIQGPWPIPLVFGVHAFFHEIVKGLASLLASQGKEANWANFDTEWPIPYNPASSAPPTSSTHYESRYVPIVAPVSPAPSFGQKGDGDKFTSPWPYGQGNENLH